MKMKFTPREGTALYDLLAEVTSDIILKADRKGYIVHASPGLERLGISLAEAPARPHIRDLVQPAFAPAIEARHEAVVAGRHGQGWAEFAACTRDGGERWFAIQMRGLADERGQIYGTLGLMRCIEERRALEEQLFAAVMSDPLTGLSNRTAFVAMLRHMLEQGDGGCLALFALDQLKAVNLRHGQSVGDEALVTFGEVIKGGLRAQDTISRVGGDRLGVLLPGVGPERAEAICRRAIAALAKTRRIPGAGELRLTASGGVARIAESVDDTLRRAEMALFFAKVSGRNRLEVDGKLPARWARDALTAQV